MGAKTEAERIEGVEPGIDTPPYDQMTNAGWAFRAVYRRDEPGGGYREMTYECKHHKALVAAGYRMVRMLGWQKPQEAA